MGGTGRGFRVKPAAATDWWDAQIPEPEPEVQQTNGEPAEGSAGGSKRRYSYPPGETSEGGSP
jgi:hypothetical protein